MHNEISWPWFDKLVESYAVLSAYTDQEKAIESDLTSVCENLAARRACIEDFTDILGRVPQAKDEVVRKVAWASQHIFGCRAWCVGQKVLFHRRHEKRWESPLLEQLDKLGYHRQKKDLKQFHSSWNCAVIPQDRIDAMLVDAKQDCVHIVKGVSFEQLRRSSRKFVPATKEPGLFAMDTKAIVSTTADSAAVATLLFTRDLIAAAFPQLKVKAHLLLIDDPGCTWKFQTHEFTHFAHSELRHGHLALDRTPAAITYRDFDHIFDKDDDAFSSLPPWAALDFLAACPVDRPTRCMMLLREMYERQQRRTTGLAVFKPSDIASAVAEQRKIAYPADLWRHDIEDCLERGRFIERRSDGDRFVLLPKGIARLLIVTRKFNPMIALTSGQFLTVVCDHAKLLAQSPVL